MAAEGLNVRGPCSSCGAQLATDQRYCVECGQRVGPPLALPYTLPVPGPAQPASPGGRLWGMPMPLQMVSAFAALSLGFGAVVGTALSPNLSHIIAAPAPVQIAQQPPEAPAAPATGGGGVPSPSTGSPTSLASSASDGSSGSGGGGGGGGGKKKHKKKKQPPAPQTLSGTVVRVNPVAGSYAISAGSLIAIHAASLPNVGQQLEVPVRRLANGTYAEIGDRNETGMSESVGFSGTVTFCEDLEQPATPCDGSSPADHYAYTVSGLGASVLVSVPVPSQGSPPKVGSRVDVSAKIGDPFQPIAPADPASWASDPTCTPPYDESSGLPADPGKQADLLQTSVNITGPATSATLESVVQTVCPGASPRLVLSGDDVRESGRDLAALGVPEGIDLTRLTPGQSVQVDVAVGDDGTLSLRGITSDQGTAGADDPAQGQGTLAGS